MPMNANKRERTDTLCNCAQVYCFQDDSDDQINIHFAHIAAMISTGVKSTRTMAEN